MLRKIEYRLKGLLNLQILLATPRVFIIELPIDLNIARVVSQINAQQISDMPDRTIAATAMHHNVPLISRDSKIRLSSIETIW